MKENRKVIVISLLLIILSSIFCLKMVSADSGWDYSYDSGGSWDSGSSWSSDSWDYYSDDYSSSNGSINDLIIIVIIFIIIFIFLYAINKNSNQNILYLQKDFTSQNNYQDLTTEEIFKLDPNINTEELKHLTFDIYKKVQEGWMNFDYNILRQYLTDEMYNMYESQLKVLKVKHQKNMIEDIKFIGAKIIDISIENNIEKIKVYLQVATKDYVVDVNNKVVRGNKNIRNKMEYIITLNKNIEKENIKKCPSCGAPIDIVSGGKCPYCDSVIHNYNDKFVMSKKECVGQNRIN